MTLVIISNNSSRQFKCTNLSVLKLAYFWGDPNNSAESRVLVFHMAGLGSIPRIPYGPQVPPEVTPEHGVRS